METKETNIQDNIPIWKKMEPAKPLMNMRQCSIGSAFKLIVREKLEGKIRYLCDKFPGTEWSGIMFYKEESGNLENKDLVLSAEDFCLLDVGTAAYTEYEVTPDVLNYQIENELLDCWWSICHSHNTMQTQFSGTDMNTLNKIGETMNHFLSLIVNNAGTYNARLTRIADESIDCKVDAKYNSFNDEQKSFNYEFKTTRKNLEWIPAEIVVCDPETLSEEEIEFLDKRIEEIDNAKKEKERERKSLIITIDKGHGTESDTYYNRWIWDDDYDYGWREPKDDVDDERTKRILYSMITGDLFPLKNVLNSNIDEVINRALKVYHVKQRVMKQMIDEIDGGIEIYVDQILSFMNAYDADWEGMMKYMERYASIDEWIEELQQVLLMYE